MIFDHSRSWSLNAVHFRRWVTVLGISLFVFSGIVHSMMHFDSLTTSAVMEVVVDSSGDAPGGPAKVVTGLEHCHGCATTPLPEIVGPAILHSSALRIPLPLALALSGIQRLFEPPPPKSLI